MTRTWITGMICSKPEGFFETPGGSPGGTRLPRGLLSVTALGIVGGGAPSGGLGGDTAHRRSIGGGLRDKYIPRLRPASGLYDIYKTLGVPKDPMGQNPDSQPESESDLALARTRTD